MTGRPEKPPEAKPEETKPSGGISGRFIRAPVATLMLTVALLLVGVLAYLKLPISSLPNVNVATFLITAEQAGADPRTNASAVTNPLEAQLGQIPGLTQMVSASANSFAQITLQFKLGTNLAAAAGDVQAALDAATAYLPKALTQPPIYRKTNPAQTPVLILGLTSNALPLTTVSDYATTILAQRLSRIEGVGLVTVGGQQTPAMRLEMDPLLLSAKGLTLADVRNMVIDQTVDGAKGVLQGQAKSYAIQTNDQIMTVHDYDDMVVATRTGAPIRVRDVGHAEIGPANSLLAGWYDTHRAVILNVLLANGANAIATIDRIKHELPMLKASLPPSIKISIVSDRTSTIRASVADVQTTLLITIGLVVVTIFVFLRSFWATVIPSVSVPLSIVGTFAVMYALDYSLDNLSLMALSIAVGFVVDDAIVMIENISRYIEEGHSPRDAALAGAGEIAFTIFSISISLTAVFIPLFLMGGVVGKMLQEFAVTVAVAIGMSVFVSLTLIPVLCAMFLKPEGETRHGRLYELVGRGFDRLLAGYTRGLDLVLRHQRLTLLTLIVTITLTGVLYAVIPKGFFPEQDTGLLDAITEAAQDVSSSGLALRQQQLTDIILKDHAVASVASYIGPGPSNASPNQGRMFIALKPLGSRGPDSGAQAVIRRLDAQVKSVLGIKLYLQAAQDLTIGARVSKSEYQYTLVDVDPAELGYWADRLVHQLKSFSNITDVGSDTVAGGEQLDDALYDAFGERVATKVFTSLGQYTVIVEVASQFRNGPNALQHIYVATPTGLPVPLGQLARIRIDTAPLVVNHQNQFPSVTISFNLKPGVSIGTAVSSVESTVRSLHMPLSVQSSFQGTGKAYQTALSGQVPLIAAALLAVYLVLGMLYESWIHPITILSTLPSAGLGALLALMAAGMPLDVIGIIGIVLLIGIVKKNGIMMVDFALSREREGMSPHDAIREACLLRFRPILMTTICAMLGGIPLIVASGIGSQIRQPLGVAIVGGLAVSQVLTVFTTPVVYLAMDRLGGLVSRRKPKPGRAHASGRRDAAPASAR